jgi:hypothetical protein
VFAAVDQSFVSSSAMKASLNEPTKFGYSSERNWKSNERQFAPSGSST